MTAAAAAAAVVQTVQLHVQEEPERGGLSEKTHLVARTGLVTRVLRTLHYLNKLCRRNLASGRWHGSLSKPRESDIPVRHPHSPVEQQVGVKAA